MSDVDSISSGSRGIQMRALLPMQAKRLFLRIPQTNWKRFEVIKTISSEYAYEQHAGPPAENKTFILPFLIYGGGGSAYAQLGKDFLNSKHLWDLLR